MEIVAGLIRQFPEGSFVIILAFLWACERAVVAVVNRNKPVVECNCDCCDEEDEDEDEES